jgi:hypothetical protein
MMKSWTLAALLATVVGCASNHHESPERAEGGEGNEIKMALNDVPAPVRATLTREAQGAAIKTVDKEQMNGKTIYETDVLANGKNWEIKVDEGGKLLSKKLDDEAEEKEEKNEKGKH